MYDCEEGLNVSVSHVAKEKEGKKKRRDVSVTAQSWRGLHEICKHLEKQAKFGRYENWQL